jgi:hypothetical protein
MTRSVVAVWPATGYRDLVALMSEHAISALRAREDLEIARQVRAVLAGG